MISRDDVFAAAGRIDGRVHRTPVMTSRLLDEMTGRTLFFKCENLQRAGSFKIRGATNKLATLSEPERARGVVAFSSGNHAQAVALAAREAGTDAVIVMASDAPEPKMQATRGYGARVELYDRRADDREAVAASIVESEGRVLVPPYDDEAIIAGQGTVSAELLDEVSDLDALFVPVGGGGLLAGCATAALGAGVRVYGAEPGSADDTARSFDAGARVTIPPPDTIADGARVTTPGEVTFPIVLERAAGIVRVPEHSITEAIELVLTRLKIVVEPTGALGLGALLAGAPEAERVGIVLSGGNLDPAALAGAESSG